MTINNARKLLGKLADEVSDEELVKEIKAAELLKTMYFSHKLSNNKAIHGKT